MSPDQGRGHGQDAAGSVDRGGDDAGGRRPLRPAGETGRRRPAGAGLLLRASEYEVEVLEEATRAAVTAGIAAAGRDVPVDGTLLIHFTGHGVRIGDTDYLVPHDGLAPAEGDEDWDQPHVVQSLVPADVSPYLAKCRAGTVLWTVDACRSPVPDDAGVRFGSTILKGPPTGRFAVLTGCRAGEVGGHTEEGSFFTLGLAEAMRPLTAARTVEEVYATAAAWTRKAAHAHGLVQRPGVRYGNDHETQTRATVVCEGRRLLESWQRAVLECPLWDRVPESEAAEADGFRRAVGKLVSDSAETVHRAQQRQPDPWADDAFPVRMLGKVLPGCSLRTPRCRRWRRPYWWPPRSCTRRPGRTGSVRRAR